MIASVRALMAALSLRGTLRGHAASQLVHKGSAVTDVTEQSADREVRRDRTTQLRWLALVALAGYLGFIHATMGIRAEHLVLAAVYITLVAVGGRAFRFLGYFLPCVLTGIIYDSFRVFGNLRGEIHVADLYHAELTLFGIGHGAERQIPAAWFATHNLPALDLVCGLSYILYLYIPLVFAIVLFFKDDRRMLMVGMAFFMTNILGMIVYLSYPAAPPWYVAHYGLGPANLAVLPSAAGAARFDHLLGIQYFTNFYKRSANVFGAMPSLHVAYPMSTFLAVRGLSKRWSVPVLVFSLVVGFAAVYLQHHYLIDVIAGFFCAVGGFALAKLFVNRFFPVKELPTAEDPVHA
jgi:inositol phosphorylceramide synthase catalytic subunit